MKLRFTHSAQCGVTPLANATFNFWLADGSVRSYRNCLGGGPSMYPPETIGRLPSDTPCLGELPLGILLDVCGTDNVYDVVEKIGGFANNVMCARPLPTDLPDAVLHLVWRAAARVVAAYLPNDPYSERVVAHAQAFVAALRADYAAGKLHPKLLARRTRDLAGILKESGSPSLVALAGHLEMQAVVDLKAWRNSQDQDPSQTLSATVTVAPARGRNAL